jgi:nitrite reductase (NO-forming)
LIPIRPDARPDARIEARSTLPMAGGSSRAGRPLGIARGDDRRITFGGLVLSGLFLVAAVVSTALSPDVRRVAWLPLHLALAGAASVAIASVVPFFTSALSAAPPAGPRARIAVIAAVAGGALGVTVGVTADQASVATAGGALFIAGLIGLGWATFTPLQHALGPRRGIIALAYGSAIADVVVGASLATLLVARWPPVVEAWGALKPAHAWLNLFGFVSLVIGGTMLHLFPTVAGSRMAKHPSATIAVRSLAAGAPLVALGYGLRIGLLVVLGGAGTLAGGVALLAYLIRSWRARSGWTTDAGWHRFTTGALASSATWFSVASGIALLRIVHDGVDPAGWNVIDVAGPLVAGWVVLAIVGAATHLVPAIGPGDPPRHRRQREILGQASLTRLALLDAGVTLLSIGLPAGSTQAILAGIAIGGAGLTLSLVLLGAAVLTRGTPRINGTDPAAAHELRQAGS